MKHKLLLLILLYSCSFLTAQTDITIPDDNFLTALIDIGLDTSGDSVIQDDEVEDVDELRINHKSISDLTGIEAFTNLVYLRADGNNLTSVDITKNTKLTYLTFSNNKLTEIDLTYNTELEELYLSDNELRLLNIEKNTKLTKLDFSRNTITDMNLLNNTALKIINCSLNNLLPVVFSNNSELEKLYCSDNVLLSLDLSANSNLSVLECNNNSLTELNIKNGNNSNLISFDARSNPDLKCVFVDNTSDAEANSNWHIPSTAKYVSTERSCITLSNDEFDSQIFSTYPNPISNSITVQALEKGNYEIYSIRGKTILIGEIEVGTNLISVSNLNSGIYFLKIKDSQGKTSIKKIIKY